MSHGNLIINFRVEFPKKGSLSTSDIETLSKVRDYLYGALILN